jgi:ribosome-binding ATPase YchF (GTP1/OBG family)
MLKLGIVGLPNVGKSTLFNALTAAKAEAANYPFCTVEPNVGMVEVPDPRLNKLSEIVRPRKTVPAVVQFVDIAGLVKGAAEGEDRQHSSPTSVRPMRSCTSCDASRIRTSPTSWEQSIRCAIAKYRVRAGADLASLEKRLDKTRRSARTGDKEAQAELPVLEKAYGFLKDGRGLWEARLTDAEKAVLAPLTLLTVKPVLYAANVSDAELSGDEGPHVKALREAVKKSGEQAEVVPFSAKIEAELAELPPEDCADFLSSLGLESAGLDRLIRAGYRLLGLETYFTAGEQEVRAWTIHRGDTAPKAAGVIHTDFERGFIRAETVSYDSFVGNEGWKGAREKGAVRSEGKEYIVQDGDVLLFRFNV